MNKVQKNLFLASILALLALTTLSCCNKGGKGDAPNSGVSDSRIAKVSGVAGEATTRVAFVGPQIHDHAMPSKLAWGFKATGVQDDPLELYVLKAKGSEPPQETSLVFDREYSGDFTFTYDTADIENNVVKYFATTRQTIDTSLGATANDRGGAYISDLTRQASNNGVVVATAPVTEVDLSSKSYGWPLVTANLSNAQTPLWTEYKMAPKPGASFSLFGNLYLLILENKSAEVDLQPQEVNGVVQNPTVTLRSNGMQFAGTTFTFVPSSHGYTITPSGVVWEMTHTIKGMKYSDTTKRVMIPFWYRPVKPANNEKFYIEIELRMTSSRGISYNNKVRLTEGVERLNINATTGTPFKLFDGFYSGGKLRVVQEELAASFGTNSFYLMDMTEISFD